MLGNGHVRFGGRGRADDLAQARHRGSPSTPTHDGRRITVEVTPDGEGLVSHAGSALLSRVADKTGLTRALSLRLGDLKSRRSGHDLGRVVRDLAVMLADGGDCLADLGAL
jgi:hypothetical protein